MPARATDQALKGFYQRLHEAPLDAQQQGDVLLYEPIYQSPGGAESPQVDPVERMARHIKWTEGESLQLFSGFRGAGKTTELLRLKQHLQSHGYLVLYANALDYVNPAGMLDISDLLVYLAGSLYDKLVEAHAADGKPLPIKSFWERLRKIFKEIQFNDVSLSAGADIKAALRRTPSFRQRMQDALAPHMSRLKIEVDDYFRTAAAVIRSTRPEQSPEIVLLFDSLEQIRGTASIEREVQRSVETVFGSHSDKLRLPDVHIVYTVPPWLKFVSPGTGPICLLPTIKQWQRDDARTPYSPGNIALRNILLRRLGPPGFAQLFGDESQADKLVAYCGGHVRDLLLLLRHVLLLARQLPVTDQVIDQATAEVRRHYTSGISVEDAIWLARISRSRAADQETSADVGRLTRFLDTHTVLYLVNGEEWYDVHPLVRNAVQQMVARNVTP